MEEILYTKCSMERKPEYKIWTSIIERDGSRFVRKKAANEFSRHHIDKIYWHFQSFQHSEGKCKLAPCKYVQPGEVDFEYIDGVSMADIIHQHRENEQWELLCSDIVQMKNLIYSYQMNEPFLPSDEFNKVFGCGDKFKGYDAARGMNIDLVADNIILKDKQQYILDYEWTLDFLIPLKFVLFRCIFLNYDISTLDTTEKKKILDIVNMDEEEWSLFFEMERNFQKYVSDISLDELYEDMGKNAYVIDHNNPGSPFYKIAVYDITGEMLCCKKTIENDSELHYEVHGNKQVVVGIGISNCIIKLQKCNAQIISSNAILVIQDDYYFSEQAQISLNTENLKELELKYDIIEKENKYIPSLALNLKQNNELKGQNAWLLEENEVYKNKTDEFQTMILELGDQKGQLEQQLLKLGDVNWRLQQDNAMLNQKNIEMQQSISSKEEQIHALQSELDLIKSKKGWALYTKIFHIDRG